VATVVAYLATTDVPESVIFCCFDEPTAELYRSEIAGLGQEP
jgi:hypothetical protein